MKKVIHVFTGELKTGTKDDVLVSEAIGSCIVVTVFNPKTETGALAHIMLPDKAPQNCSELKTRYAENAIEGLLTKMSVTAADLNDLCICAAGAGNVLKRKDDSICRNNIRSVKKILKNKNLNLAAKALGGTKRRSVRFDISKREVLFTEDGSQEILLWRRDE